MSATTPMIRIARLARDVHPPSSPGQVPAQRADLGGRREDLAPTADVPGKYRLASVSLTITTASLVGGVLSGEGSALEQPGAHGLEVALADGVMLRLRAIFRPAGRLIRRQERVAPAVLHRQEVGAAGRQHARLLAQPVEERRMLVGHGPPGRFARIGARQLNGRENHVLAAARRAARASSGRRCEPAARSSRGARRRARPPRRPAPGSSRRVPRELPRSPALR